MKQRLLFLCGFLFLSTFLSGQPVEFRQDRMVSFSHFLVGISKIFPEGISFNENLFFFRHGNISEDEIHVKRIRKFVQALSQQKPTLRDFELLFYGLAKNETSVFNYFHNLLKKWNIPEDPQIRKSFLYLYCGFVTSFTGDKPFIQKTMDNIESHESFRIFRNNLQKMSIIFEIPDNQYSFIVIPIPLYCRAEEMPTLRKLGVQGIFGLNLDEMQIIEIPVISGNPKITVNAINHLFGITLHEICHFFYYKSRFYQNILGSKNIADKNVRNLVAEGIATALGNGAFAERIGNTDFQWYADPKINIYAHNIFPKISNYLNKSKPLDFVIADFLVNLAQKTLASPPKKLTD